jgi:Family of unknown function (DUF6401)
MTSEFPVTKKSTPATPEVVLDDLMAKVGVDGLAAALANPGLMAEVDQHAAAVRESLAASGLVMGAVPLAGYASSVAAAAVRMGHELADPATADWTKASWFQLRLMAVCALAIEQDSF